MNRVPRTLCRSALVLITITGLGALPAAAQTSGGTTGKKTAAPAGWQEKWVGMYEGQDRAGKIAPPGIKVLPPPERDTIALVESLLQPWAKARGKSTSYELEDPGQLCRPTGPLRGNAVADFELVASPEKITIIGGTGGGILTGGIRRIYLNRPHLKNPPLTYFGDSIAHWEGETLVLDAVGFNEKTWFTRDPQRHTEALQISERWKFVANDKWLEKTITVDDRFALTAPFTVTWYFEKQSNDTPEPERLCLDTPEARRAWLKLYKQYEQDYEDERKNMGSEDKLTEER
jgi:hypothetical protein